MNVLRNAVHLKLRVVDCDLRVCHSHYIDFTSHRFFLEEGPLSYADTDAHLRAANMVKGWLNLGATLADE